MVMVESNTRTELSGNLINKVAKTGGRIRSKSGKLPLNFGSSKVNWFWIAYVKRNPNLKLTMDIWPDFVRIMAAWVKWVKGKHFYLPYNAGLPRIFRWWPDNSVQKYKAFYLHSRIYYDMWWLVGLCSAMRVIMYAYRDKKFELFQELAKNQRDLSNRLEQYEKFYSIYWKYNKLGQTLSFEIDSILRFYNGWRCMPDSSFKREFILSKIQFGLQFVPSYIFPIFRDAPYSRIGISNLLEAQYQVYIELAVDQRINANIKLIELITEPSLPVLELKITQLQEALKVMNTRLFSKVAKLTYSPLVSGLDVQKKLIDPIYVVQQLYLKSRHNHYKFIMIAAQKYMTETIIQLHGTYAQKKHNLFTKYGRTFRSNKELWADKNAIRPLRSALQEFYLTYWLTYESLLRLVREYACVTQNYNECKLDYKPLAVFLERMPLFYYKKAAFMNRLEVEFRAHIQRAAKIRTGEIFNPKELAFLISRRRRNMWYPGFTN